MSIIRLPVTGSHGFETKLFQGVNGINVDDSTHPFINVDGTALQAEISSLQSSVSSAQSAITGITTGGLTVLPIAETTFVASAALVGTEAVYNFLDGTAAIVTMTLPQLAIGLEGRVYWFNCLNNTHAVTIQAHAGDTINGGTITLTTGQVCAIVASFVNSTIRGWHFMVKVS